MISYYKRILRKRRYVSLYGCTAVSRQCTKAGVKAYAIMFFFNDTKQIKETVTILSTRFLLNNICITCCALLFSFISLIKVFNVKNLCNNAYSLIPTLRSSGNIMPKVTMGNGGRCMIALLKLELFQSDGKKPLRHKTAYSCFPPFFLPKQLERQ